MGPRRAMLRAALTGLALGVAWGVAARVFMRLVATNPEFSWGGTLAIVVLAGILGSGVGLAAEAHRQDRRRWWYLALLPGMVLFASPGMLLLPAFVLGSLSLARWRGALGWSVAAGAAIAPVVMVWWSARFEEDTMLSTPLSQQFWLLVGFPFLGFCLAWYGFALWKRTSESPQADAPFLAKEPA